MKKNPPPPPFKIKGRIERHLECMLGPSHWLKGKKILPSPLPPTKLKRKKTKAP